MTSASLLIVAILTAWAGDVPVSAPTGSCQILAPHLDVSPGEEIRAPILLKGAPGFIAMEVDITYDAAVVEALGADLGPLGANMLMEVGLRKPGLVVMSLATAQTGPKGDGELLTVRFRVKGAAGQECPLQFKHVRAWRSDNELEVPLELVAGRLVVASALSAFPWWWIALSACGAIALLVAAVGLIRRRRRAPTAAPPRQAAAPAAICSKCGAAVAPGVKFCGQCGQAAPPPEAAKPELGPKCAASLPAQAKFCGECGHLVGPAPVGPGASGGASLRLMLFVLLATAGIAMGSVGAYGVWRHVSSGPARAPRGPQPVADTGTSAPDARVSLLPGAAKAPLLAESPRPKSNPQPPAKPEEPRSEPPQRTEEPRTVTTPDIATAKPDPGRAAPDQPAAARVPPLDGLSAKAAREKLAAAGLEADFVLGDPALTADKAGAVYATEPAEGTPLGDTKRIRVMLHAPSGAGADSPGDDQVAVPDVMGRTAAEAREAFEAARMKFKFVLGEPAGSGKPAHQVYRVEPSPGQRVSRSSEVQVMIYGPRSE